jgi:hypothetical protein
MKQYSGILIFLTIPILLLILKKHFAGKNESSQRNDSAKEFQDKLKSLIQNLETKKSPDATEKPAST